jgi:hypothetical protein
MLVGNGLRYILAPGISVRDTRTCRCAIPNRATLPQERETLFPRLDDVAALDWRQGWRLAPDCCNPGGVGGNNERRFPG